MQAALKLVLEPIFEAEFQPYSYGFRPRRRAHDAIAEIHNFVPGVHWVLEADIEACFDRIDHAALMGRVRKRVTDKRVLALVRAFLKAGVMTEEGVNREPTRELRRAEFCRRYWRTSLSRCWTTTIRRTGGHEPLPGDASTCVDGSPDVPAHPVADDFVVLSRGPGAGRAVLAG